MRLTIIVGGRFHAFDLVIQLQKKRIPFVLITSYPRFFVKKYNIKINHVKSIFIKEFLKRFFDKFMIINKIFDYDYWLSFYFSKRAANIVNYKKTDILIGWSGFSLHSFKSAQKFNCIKILERGSAHILHQVKILKEEYKKLKLKGRLPSKKIIKKELMEYELADYISVPSEFVKKSFLDRGFDKDKIVKIPYGVDLKNFTTHIKKNNLKKNKFTILSVGTVSVRKGSVYLLKAFEELNLPDSELIFVGPVDIELKKIVKNYDLKENIKFFKKQPQKKLSNFYNLADVFVLFSVEDGFGMVINQAMACGLPVICNQNVGGSDVIDQGVNGFVLPAKDINLLKKKILTLYSDRTLLEKMKRNAFKKAKLFLSWDNYGKNVIKFYKKTLLNSIN
jgi:glycosyltransferase involved in cell wall biosynthesis